MASQIFNIVQNVGLLLCILFEQIDYTETSAKERIHIDETFHKLIQLMRYILKSGVTVILLYSLCMFYIHCWICVQIIQHKGCVKRLTHFASCYY